MPTKQLFVAKRVSKAWKAIIEGSLSLQKKMFLVAISPSLKQSSLQPTGYMTRVEYDQAMYLNPVLPAQCVSSRHFKDEDEDEDEDGSNAFDPFPGECDISANKTGRLLFCIVLAPAYGQLKAMEPRGDWKKLLLTEPPVTAIEQQLLGQGFDVVNDASKGYLCTVYNAAGITLGDIYDVQRQLYRQCTELLGLSVQDSYV